VMGGLGLGLAVSADGVTTDTQRAFLLAIGCGAGQGPYYGAPLTAADLQPPDLWPPADLHPPDLRTEHRLDTP